VIPQGDAVPVGLGNHFLLDIEGFENGVHVDAINGGFVNGCSTFRANTVNCRNHYHQTGDGTTGTAFAQNIDGVIQGSGERGYWNETARNGPHFRVQWWDLGGFGTNAIVGPGATYENSQADLQGHTDGSAGVMGQRVNDEDGQITSVFHESDLEVGFEPINSHYIRMFTEEAAGYTRTWGRIDHDARVWEWLENPGLFPKDLTSENPSKEGELSFHDGSGTPSQSLCWGVAAGGNWYNIRDGGTF
jgi:hypothetical protein